MQPHINKESYHHISNQLDNCFQRVIQRHPKAGKRAGWAFSIVMTTERACLGAAGLVENVGLGVLNGLAAPFHETPRKCFIKNLKNTRDMTILTLSVPFMPFIDVYTYWNQPKENRHLEYRGNWKPIHFAAANNDIDAIKDLATNQVDLNVLTQKFDDFKKYSFKKETQTPLHIACMNSNPEAVSCLLELGSNPTIENGLGQLPLQVAVFNENIPVLKALLDHGVDIDATDHRGYSAMHYAAISVHREQGVPAVITNRSKYQEVIEFLASRKANLDLKNQDGETPLMLAAMDGMHENEKESLVAFKAMIDAGANVNIQDNHGSNVGHRAIRCSRSNDVLEALLSHPEFDVNIQDEDGSTILHLAALRTNTDLFGKIAKHPKIDPNIQDKEGRTAADHCVTQERLGRWNVAPSTVSSL